MSIRRIGPRRRPFLARQTGSVGSVRSGILGEVERSGRAAALAPVNWVDADLRTESAVVRARRLLDNAARVVQSAMTNARLGNPIQIGIVRHAAYQVAEEVLRDRSLMMMVCRLQHSSVSVFSHSVNVCVLMVSFARQYGCPFEDILSMATASLLHDISRGAEGGDVGEGEDPLHMLRAVELLAASGLPRSGLAMIRDHHEHFDGSGYPNGRRGDDISPWGRMITIVDAYEALTSGASGFDYEPPDAMARIFSGAGNYYESRLVSVFIRAVGIYPVGTLVRLLSNRLAIVVEHRPEALLRPRVRVVYDVARCCRLSSMDLDLAIVGRDEDRIIGCEPPERWEMDLADFC